MAERIVAEKMTRDDAVRAVRAAAVEPKGRGGTPATDKTKSKAKTPKPRPVAHVFRVAGARVTVDFTRKTFKEADVLAALDGAAEQVRAAIAAQGQDGS